MNRITKISGILAWANIVFSVLVGYCFYLMHLVQDIYVTHYPDEMERYTRDIWTFWLVTLFLAVYLLLESIFTISWLKGNRNIQLFLLISTLLHFFALSFFTAKYYYEFLFLLPIFVTFLIDFLFIWRMKKN